MTNTTTIPRCPAPGCVSAADARFGFCFAHGPERGPIETFPTLGVVETTTDATFGGAA